MENNSYIIAGLGNPGDEYKNTRHNVGFIAIEKLRDSLGGDKFKLNKNFKAEISEIRYENYRLYLIKPQTFMNLSGQSVSLLAGFYKIPNQNIFIIHDDKDLPLGQLRIRDMGSSGGHNGIKSIAECLGTLNFLRFRLGISNPNLSIEDTSRYVLGRLSKEESEQIVDFIDKTNTPAILETLKHGMKSAQNKFNS